MNCIVEPVIEKPIASTGTKQPLTHSEVVALASELHHILWTPDTVRPDPSMLRRFPGRHNWAKGNWNCASYAGVCCALNGMRGEKVTSRRGIATILYPTQEGGMGRHDVLKHFWISTSSGLCDLSISPHELSDHKPVIFENRNLADQSWRVFFGRDPERFCAEIKKCGKARIPGVFYCTTGKKDIGEEDIEQFLQDHFPPAVDQNVALTYGDIVVHCERFLEGNESLRHLPQVEAWQRLAARGSSF